MKYISRKPNPSGAYPAPQSSPAPGLVPISDTFAIRVVALKGFVRLAILDGRVIGLEPNEEALEAWDAAQAERPAEGQETAPTAQDDTDAMLVDHEYRLTLLELGLTE